MPTAREDVLRLFSDYNALESAIGLMNWDMQVLMPPLGAKARTAHIGILTSKAHAIITSDELGRALEKLESEADAQRRLGRKIRRWLPRRPLEKKEIREVVRLRLSCAAGVRQIGCRLQDRDRNCLRLCGKDRINRIRIAVQNLPQSGHPSLMSFSSLDFLVQHHSSAPFAEQGAWGAQETTRDEEDQRSCSATPFVRRWSAPDRGRLQHREDNCLGVCRENRIRRPELAVCRRTERRTANILPSERPRFG